MEVDVAGKIIYFYGLFSMAMLNNQMVIGKMGMNPWWGDTNDGVYNIGKTSINN